MRNSSAIAQKCEHRTFDLQISVALAGKRKILPRYRLLLVNSFPKPTVEWCRYRLFHG
jgi:hypothetical protein